MTSQHRLQKLLGRFLRVALILSGLLLSQGLFPSVGSAQEPRLTKPNIVDSLKNGARHRAEKMTVREYVELIQKRGVDFQMTAADAQEIRNAGSYYTPAQLKELIEAVRANYRAETTSLWGAIEQVEVVPNPGGGVQVFLRLLIRNDGPPTPTQKYQLAVTHLTTKEIDFKSGPSALKERYTLPQEKGPEEIVIQPQDSIVRKTIEAIPRGQTVTGWLRFALPLPSLTTNFMSQSGIRYALTFTDATGKAYSATYETP